MLGIEVPVIVGRVREGSWCTQRWTAMGSHVELVVADAPDRLMDWAAAEIERLEQSWSRFRPGSEVRALNASAERWIDVSVTLLDALVRAEHLYRLTNGAFDPTILAALERSGYDRTFEVVRAVPDRGPTAAAEPAPGFSSVVIDRDARRVGRAPGVRIDLGGIGKGLAADIVAEGLIDRGASSACLSLGGDVRVTGTPPAPAGWPVPVEDPHEDGRELFVWPLPMGAIVTSTCLTRTWVRGGVRQHHLVDPSTGAPARRGVAAVVVAGAEAWLAEGYAKAAVVRGAAVGAELLRQAGLNGWIIGDDRAVMTAHMAVGP